MPAALLNENIMNAVVDFRKASIVTDSIITAIQGTPIEPTVSIRESAFIFALVTNGGTILDVINMREAGLLSPDAMSTFASLKKSWEDADGN
jgi:hypothetical protein